MKRLSSKIPKVRALNQLIIFELSQCLSLKSKIKLSGVCKELHRKIHYKNASGEYICLKTNDVEQLLFFNIASDEKKAIILILIKSVVDINFQNEHGETALFIASYMNRKDIVKLLLEYKADPNIQDGDTALIGASYEGNEEIVELLLEYKANPDLQDDDGDTALIGASYKGNEGVVKLLLDNNADINIQNIYGKTALIEASYNGREEIVKLLLENNAKVNIQDNICNTALIWAFGEGHEEIVKLLEK